MGVIYKLKDEVVDFIISQRKDNPLSSCRQLAESASQKFGLQLSKSSVHDVLKESGIVTPRGRKPKDKFEIPQEKKKQIQVSLSQVKLLPASIEPAHEPTPVAISVPSLELIPEPMPESVPEPKPEPVPEPLPEPKLSLMPDVTVSEPEEPSTGVKRPNTLDIAEVSSSTSEAKQSFNTEEIASSPSAPRNDTTGESTTLLQNDITQPTAVKEDLEVSAEHEGAGKIFLKAALWDLGVFSEENIKETDWDYYLTYTKGIKVILDNSSEFFIDLPLPIERCIRETVDGLVNNVKPLIVDKVSDKELFRATMEAETGFKIKNISIVGCDDHNLLDLTDIMEFKRKYSINSMIFVENKEKNIQKRAKSLFLSQVIDNNNVIENILNLKGFDAKNKHEIVITLIINDGYENKAVLQEAIDKLNGMFLRDGENRLVRVKIRTPLTPL